MGLGYIGLPISSLLATKGFKVHGVDITKKTVDTINSGKVHIVEPDLDILVKSAVNSGNLKASQKPIESDVFILAVPTPFNEKNNVKTPDISYVMKATEAITPFIRENNLIILESTSPTFTTEKIAEQIFKSRPELQNKIYIAHCPERVLPGNIIRELVDNDRIIGGINDESSKKAGEFYEKICSGNIYLTDSRTAELTKLVENSYRDVNIAFANELSIICDKLDINVWEVIEMASKHPRVNILSPGPGVGGHCIAVDPWFIVSSCPEESKLIRTAREVNLSKTQWVLNKIKDKSKKIINPVIGCLGLSFKADIDDLRESPAMEIATTLIKEKYNVIANEPNIEDKEVENIPLFDVKEVIEKSDILCLLVNHKEYKHIHRNSFDEKIIIDTIGLQQNLKD